MNTSPSFSQQDFEQALTPQILLQSQIVYGAILSGMTIFALIVFAVIGQQPVNETSSVSTVQILSIVNFFAAMSIYTAAKFVYQMQFRSLQIGSIVVQDCIRKIQQALIIRIALFEGAGFFGLTVCIIAFTTGVAKDNPEYLFNSLTALITLLFGAITFPTKDSVLKIFQEQILHLN